MTIYQLKKPCFLLDWGPHPDDEGHAHYDTHAEAQAVLAGERGDGDGDEGELVQLAPARIRELPYLCWVAECDAPDGPEGTCGDTLGDDDEGPACIHFASADELFEWMPGEGWTRLGADGALCWTCCPEGAASPEPSPVELEAAGQLRFPGVA